MSNTNIFFHKPFAEGFAFHVEKTFSWLTLICVCMKMTIMELEEIQEYGITYNTKVSSSYIFIYLFLFKQFHLQVLSILLGNLAKCIELIHSPLCYILKILSENVFKYLFFKEPSVS